MVLCVGNHSSGKSSFINYVLQRPIQTSGVAPTDDNFTIIAPAITPASLFTSSLSHNNDAATDHTNGKNIPPPPPPQLEYDQDGFAIIGNPDYGFTSLQQFGPTLQHHTVFKFRPDLAVNFMMGTYICCVLALYCSLDVCCVPK
jgi:hypothetical protein